VVRYRRAMVVLASAGGNTVEVIARLVQTSPDRVREMIHRFNELGMRSLDPKWAGGRPRRITTEDETFIVETAKARPEKAGLPFTLKLEPKAERDFFNDTSPAYVPDAAKDAWGMTLDWFAAHLTA